MLYCTHYLKSLKFLVMSLHLFYVTNITWTQDHCQLLGALDNYPNQKKLNSSLYILLDTFKYLFLSFYISLAVDPRDAWDYKYYIKRCNIYKLKKKKKKISTSIFFLIFLSLQIYHFIIIIIIIIFFCV